jgi:hypothetical protein
MHVTLTLYRRNGHWWGRTDNPLVPKLLREAPVGIEDRYNLGPLIKEAVETSNPGCCVVLEEPQ